MKVPPSIGPVDAATDWLEPHGEGMADLVARAGRSSASRQGEIVGSRASGYRSAGAHFYTWQPERAEVVSWVAELAPFDRAAPRGDR
jgi:hypothetical protein